jgi:hypothetical protein
MARHRRSIILCGVVVAAAVGLPLAAARAQSQAATYHLAASPDGAPGLRVDLPYTFGTHQFEVRDVRGEVRVDWTGAPSVSGRLSVALTALRGGGETLTCHMQEAMGLDYAKSAFPGDHVCSGGKLPASGKDAIAFPEIAFEIKSARLAAPAKQKVRVSVTGRWTMHGISHDDTFDLDLTPMQGNAGHPTLFRLEGARKIRLASYGIQVKRALVISAGEEATVKINLVLEERT